MDVTNSVILVYMKCTDRIEQSFLSCIGLIIKVFLRDPLIYTSFEHVLIYPLTRRYRRRTESSFDRKTEPQVQTI